MPTFFERCQNDWANTFDEAPYEKDILTMIHLGYSRKDGKSLEDIDPLPPEWEWKEPPGENRNETKTSLAEIESYVVVNHKKKQLRIIIPGTHNRYDLWKDYKLLTIKTIDPHLAKRIIKKLVLMQQDLYEKTGTYYSTDILGHSLGGTVAQLVTMMLNTAKCEEKLANICSNSWIQVSKKRLEKGSVQSLVFGRNQQQYSQKLKQYLDSGSPISALCFDPAGLNEKQRDPNEKKITLFDNDRSSGKLTNLLSTVMASGTPDHSNILNIKTIPNLVSALNGSPGKTKIKVCPIIFDLIEWHLARVEAGKANNDEGTKEKATQSAEQMTTAFVYLHKMATFGQTTKELLEILKLYPTDDEEKKAEIDHRLSEPHASHFYQISDDDWVKWSQEYMSWHDTVANTLNTVTDPGLLFYSATSAYQLITKNPVIAASVTTIALTATAVDYLTGKTATQHVKETTINTIKKKIFSVGGKIVENSMFEKVKTGALQTQNPCLRKKHR